jgi:hypothetical protein
LLLTEKSSHSSIPLRSSLCKNCKNCKIVKTEFIQAVARVPATMNIFFLSKNAKKSAMYHNDKHVVKMILEYAQILSTVCNLNGIQTEYKSTHEKHPCVIWCGESINNFKYLICLIWYLNEEYKYRYSKANNHKSFDVASRLPLPDLPDIPITPIPLCMPDDCKSDCVIDSYRMYYMKHKNKFCNWKNREIPYWYKEVTCTI